MVAAHQDAAVDDGYQVGVGGEVEYRARPGPVDAAEQDVTVQRSGQSVGFHDRQVHRGDGGVFGGGGAAQASGKNLDLGASQ